jgi:hypothetical protein
MTDRVVWQHVDRSADTDGSGWWVLARLIVRDDGTAQIETNTRSSVVSTQVELPPEALDELRRAL